MRVGAWVWENRAEDEERAGREGAAMASAEGGRDGLGGLKMHCGGWKGRTKEGPFSAAQFFWNGPHSVGGGRGRKRTWSSFI